LNIFAGENRNDPAFYERITVENRVFNRKHYLWPLRDVEFDKVHKTVVQNPGWPGSVDQ